MNCSYTVNNGQLEERELKAYYDYALKKYGKAPKHIDIKLDGEFIELDFSFNSLPFERLRRITGYLVGSLDRFNNGKRQEEKDRVKHNI